MTAEAHPSGIAWAYIINVFISFFMIYTHISLYSSGSLYFSSTLLCAEAFWHYIYITGRNLALWIAQIAGFFKFNANPAQGVQYHMSRCPEWSHKKHTATQCFHIQAWWLDVKLLFAIDTKHALQCKHVSKIQTLRLQIPWRGSSVLRTWNVPVFCVNTKDSRRTMLSRIGSVSY